MHTLVTTDELAVHLDHPDWVIFDCRFDLSKPQAGKAAYEKAHIAGARYADLERDLSGPIGPRSGRHPLPDPAVLADKLGDWGVGPGTRVVAYDDRGGMFAARLWWLVRWLGHDNATVLDGGLSRWRAEGRALDDELPEPTARSLEPRVNDDSWLTTAAIEQLVEGERDECLIDARAQARYAGEQEPVDRVAGHIPGAVNLPFKDNLQDDMRFRPPAELAARFEAALDGRDAAKAVHACGSGVTACHNLLAMEVAGLRGSRLYAGSYSEWIRDPNRPIETE